MVAKEEAPQILVYGASSCLKRWCRRSESNWHGVTPPPVFESGASRFNQCY